LGSGWLPMLSIVSSRLYMGRLLPAWRFGVELDVGMETLLPREPERIRPLGVVMARLKDGEPGTPAAPQAPGGGEAVIGGRLWGVPLVTLLSGRRCVWDTRRSRLDSWSGVGPEKPKPADCGCESGADTDRCCT
jgi:hypothetical protein